MFQGTLDNDLADLLGIGEASQPEKVTFNNLFKDEIALEKGKEESVDLEIKKFEVPKHLFSDTPDPLFTTNDYYRTVLDGEDQESERFHKILNAFVKATDSQEKSTYRGQLTGAFANLGARFAAKICMPNFPKPKQFALRYGLVTPALITPEVRTLIGRIIQEKVTTEPIFYCDEWIRSVAVGAIKASAQDETQVAKVDKESKSFQQIDNIEATIRSNKDLIQIKSQNLIDVERMLVALVQRLTEKEEHPRFPELNSPYTGVHKNIFSEISSTLSSLRNLNKDLEATFNDLGRNQDRLDNLKQSLGDEYVEQTSVDSEVLAAEYGNIRQMAKMCNGRQGNHIPVLMNPFIRNEEKNLGTRERVLTILHELESIDSELFMRTFKRETYRIVPYFILIPCYGDSGLCWEPFERNNRATSRGRLAVPMYPKDLKLAIVTALADFRWQIAKERAGHYWMEEGVTGGYFQYYTDNKLKGNIKELFIKDYILWIMKESEGIQKLEKEVRRVFWRHMPFGREIKDSLRNRGTVYMELCQTDVNRAKSDGY